MKKPLSARPKFELTPWGRRVKVRLAQLGMTQRTLCHWLQGCGYEVSYTNMCDLLHGRGVSARGGEIAAINECLNLRTKSAG